MGCSCSVRLRIYLWWLTGVDNCKELRNGKQLYASATGPFDVFQDSFKSQSLPITSKTSDITAAEFAIDDIFSGASGEAPIGTFNLNQTDGSAKIDVTTALQNASNDISFMLMGRYKGTILLTRHILILIRLTPKVY